MDKILLATNNENKLKEFREILNEYEIISMKDINCFINVEEDGITFEENAIKKAKEISLSTNYPCISDDSGLSIKFYDDWPGVQTARFLGENSTSEQRNEYILQKMKSLKKEDRKAQVICSLAYYYNDKYITANGIINGYISEKRKGDNGFGFDEIFQLENGKTLAELTPEEKNSISARKLAIEELKQKLKVLANF